MRKYNEYQLTFRDYNLTELMTVSNGKKKAIGDNYAIFTIVSDLLLNYGIHLYGGTTILNSSTTVRCMRLNRKFPLENFGIIEQCYGFEKALINITLDRNDSCEYAFIFNTETKHCTLQKHVWGEVEKEVVFNSFAEMWSARKKVKKDYEKLFKN